MEQNKNMRPTNENKRETSPNAGNGNADKEQAQPTRENVNLSGDTGAEQDKEEPGKQAQGTDMPDESEKDVI